MVAAAAKESRVWPLPSLVISALGGALCCVLAIGCGAADGPVSNQPLDGASQGPGQPSPAASDTPIVLEDLPPDPREQRLGPLLAKLLPAQHLLHTPLDDALSRQAFEVFLGQLDGDKLLLLKGHVDALRAYEADIDDELKRGDLVLARKGAALLIQRQRVVSEIIGRVLAAPFDFTRLETLETDPSKRGYCTTDAALEDRWRMVLKLLALEQLARLPAQTSHHSPDFVAAEAAARGNLAQIFSARLARRDQGQGLEPAQRLINAVASTYDAHTRYFSPSAQQRLSVATTGSEEGVGVVLSERGGELVVSHIEAGGPAAMAPALVIGDVIVAVAESGGATISLRTVPLNQASALLRGAKGTVVTVTVRKGNGATQLIRLTRDVVARDEAYARATEVKLAEEASAQSFGYIWLPSFYDNRTANSGQQVRDATMDVRRHLDGFRTRKRLGLILDLRGNRGGIVQHAVDIAGLLIKKGPIVQTLDADGKLGKLVDIHPITNFDEPVVVLVDAMTASAAEILAAALQDYQRALIVGSPTYGKGTVQQAIDLDRHAFGAGPVAGQPLGLLRITTEQYFGVDGASPQRTGVQPEIVLPDPSGHLNIGERYLPGALPPRTIAPLPFVRYPSPPSTSAAIAQVAVHPDFMRLVAHTALLKQGQQASAVGLERNAWLDARNRLSAGIAGAQLSGDVRLTVKVVDGGNAAPKPGGSDVHLDAWVTQLSKDIWVEQAVELLTTMR